MIFFVRLKIFQNIINNKFPKKKSNQSFFNGHNYVSNFFRFLSILMIPAAAMSPSAVAWYWMASGLSGLAVNLTLLSPKFRNFVKIPRLPENSYTPYRDVIDNVNFKLKRTMSRFKVL